MNIIGAGLFWIVGALIGAVATIASLLRHLKDAETPSEPQGEAEEAAPEGSCASSGSKDPER